MTSEQEFIFLPFLLPPFWEIQPCEIYIGNSERNLANEVLLWSGEANASFGTFPLPPIALRISPPPPIMHRSYYSIHLHKNKLYTSLPSTSPVPKPGQLASFGFSTYMLQEICHGGMR
jgi:hypothetical protein